MKSSVKLNLITYITTSKKHLKILVSKSRTERINYLSGLLFSQTYCHFIYYLSKICCILSKNIVLY